MCSVVVGILLYIRDVMARLKEFRFVWTDACHQIDRGYDSLLQTSENGDVSIKVLVNTKPFEIDLFGIEDSFIEDLENIRVGDWKNKFFEDPWTVDGDIWKLSLTYDSHHIIAEGMNGYPESFTIFLGLLHNKYNLPKAEIENIRWILHNTKHTEIKDITHIEFATYL